MAYDLTCSNQQSEIYTFVALIYGVDSLKLLKEIKQAAKKNEPRNDCLPVHIAGEETKFDDKDELTAILTSLNYKK
jgi:uncharacterized pyridoxal phosphate-containing UPF0001 family protein